MRNMKSDFEQVSVGPRQLAAFRIQMPPGTAKSTPLHAPKRSRMLNLKRHPEQSIRWLRRWWCIVAVDCKWCRIDKTCVLRGSHAPLFLCSNTMEPNRCQFLPNQNIRAAQNLCRTEPKLDVNVLAVFGPYLPAFMDQSCPPSSSKKPFCETAFAKSTGAKYMSQWSESWEFVLGSQSWENVWEQPGATTLW